jgi:hypothetical protein
MPESPVWLPLRICYRCGIPFFWAALHDGPAISGFLESLWAKVCDHSAPAWQQKIIGKTRAEGLKIAQRKEITA